MVDSFVGAYTLMKTNLLLLNVAVSVLILSEIDDLILYITSPLIKKIFYVMKLLKKCVFLMKKQVTSIIPVGIDAVIFSRSNIKTKIRELL